MTQESFVPCCTREKHYPRRRARVLAIPAGQQCYGLTTGYFTIPYACQRDLAANFKPLGLAITERRAHVSVSPHRADWAAAISRHVLEAFRLEARVGSEAARVRRRNRGKSSTERRTCTTGIPFVRDRMAWSHQDLASTNHRTQTAATERRRSPPFPLVPPLHQKHAGLPCCRWHGCRVSFRYISLTGTWQAVVEPPA